MSSTDGPQQPYQSAPSYPQGYGGYQPVRGPEAESVRSSALVWLIVNICALVLTGNLGSIVGLILDAMAMNRVDTDLDGARRLVRWSWIWLIIGYAVGILFALLMLVLIFGGLITMGGLFATLDSSYPTSTPGTL